MGQRMFVAFHPPKAVTESLVTFLDGFPRVTWTNPKRWHVTLAFMGSVPEDRVDDLAGRLRLGFAGADALMVRLFGAGCFPNPKRATVAWMRPQVVGGDAALNVLAEVARRAAGEAGVEVDAKGFVPHLTVARFKGGRNASDLIGSLDSFQSEPWLLDRVSLVASHRGGGASGGAGGGVQHEVVETFRLQRQTA